jgi:hypothetical protein
MHKNDATNQNFKKMNKIKKSFALVAALLLMSSSSLSAFSSSTYDECFILADIREGIALYWGFSASQAYEMGSNAFDSCVDNINIQAAINQQ